MAYLEYAPNLVHENTALIDELVEQEKIFAANKGSSGDREIRRQAEQQADQKRQLLIKKADSSIIHDYLKTTKIADADAFRTAWQKNLPPIVNQTWLNLVQPTPDLNHLPKGSFCFNVKFTLAKPYLSRDDNDFYIIDNPIVREKVFRWPMVRPSAWKGSLRHALWPLGYQKDCQQIERIFGTIRKETEGRAGRLYLYPTFFDQIDLEIINPHDRQKRVGKNPILLECVPIGTQGTFSLLYAPVDLIGQDDQIIYQEVAADMRLLAKGLQALLTIYGFGAKTSSGFGLAEDGAVGEIKVNYPDSSQVPSKRGFSRFGDLVAVVDELVSIIEGGMA